MTGEPEFVREPSTIEFGGSSGPGRRPWWLPVAIALVVGLALGFLIGRQQRQPPPAAPMATTEAETQPIVATGRLCAITLAGPGGHDDLELGAEVRNLGGPEVTVATPGVRLPMGGLSVAEPPMLTACGELPGITEMVLAHNAGIWLSVRLHVPGGGCPAAYPVQFVVNYLIGGRHRQASVGGFNDLGKVPYPSCTA